MIRVAKISMAHVHAGGYAAKFTKTLKPNSLPSGTKKNTGEEQQQNNTKSRSTRISMKSSAAMMWMPSPSMRSHPTIRV